MKAANARGLQVFITTHSPVLLSQFAAEESFAAELKGDRAQLTRLSDVEGIEDLLEQYAAGSLYMATIIAPPGHARCRGARSARGRRAPGGACAALVS
ncbi:ATP-binding protein [Chondromyces apiculatus]|uniref:ATP-binding protein n=1 Tax=Chondromyces apiculatus TaxID=51 RepID=UPI001E38AB7F|nr:ATP-binding protein [Chondromyces apiculatus]